MASVSDLASKLPPNLKIDAGTRGHGDAERGIFMHGGEKIFFIGTAFCLLPGW